MGPGPRKYRQVANRDVVDRVGSVKAGEVPVFYDNTNPRMYRRLVCDWIAFQDLYDDDSSRKLTRGQQVIAIITNIRGNAGLRVGNVPSMLKKTMTREEFMKVVDFVLDIVDPLDRESAFLQTAKAWQDLMQKVHQKNQTYDKYWSEYSALSLHYAYSHGEAAKTTGIQELLALLCVLNAKLPRSEFSIVLQAAMRFQKDQPARSGTGERSQAPVLVGPASASRALSFYSDMGGDGTGPERDVTAESPAAPAIAASSSAAPSLRSRERTQPHVHESLGICSVELEEMDSRAQEVLRAINAATAEMDAWTTVAPDEDAVNGVMSRLRNAGGKSMAIGTAISSTSSVVNALTVAANNNNLSYATSHRAVLPDTEVDEVTIAEEEPLITLEAVRTALRRIDHGELAAKSVERASGPNESLSAVGTSALSALAGTPPDLKCWVCEGTHFYYESPACKKIHEERRSRREKPTGTPRRSRDGAASKKDGPKKFGGTALSRVRWADPPDTSLSKLAYVLKGSNTQSGKAAIQNTEAIIDGGATATVIGLTNYVAFCDDSGMEAIVEDKADGDFDSHAFGTEYNHSDPEKVVGRCKVPLAISDDVVIEVLCLVVDGDVPLIIGKDTLVLYKCIEAHEGNWVTFEVDGRVIRVATHIKDNDGHARIRMHGLHRNIARAMLMDVPSRDGAHLGIIRRIHARTHLHPRSVELLLKRAGKWRSEMGPEIAKIQAECTACIRSGDPPPANKFSMSRIHLHFNERLYVDVMYWGSAMVFHVVDYATSYSELALIQSRDLRLMLRTLASIWILRHGDPKEIFGDAEFNKGIARAWANQMAIKLVALPSRRHNKSGTVERKHRVIKDVMERLENDRAKSELPLEDKLREACFIGNIMYGNRTASSFELVRGYTPSLSGSGLRLLSDEAREAHAEMVARRLLAKVLKARPSSAGSRNIRIGDPVLVLLPGGKRPRGRWVERTVRSIREDYSVVVGTGRGRCVVAPEDVRTLPKSPMAAVSVRASMGVNSGRERESAEQNVPDVYDQNLDSPSDDESSSSDDNDKNSRAALHGHGDDISDAKGLVPPAVAESDTVNGEDAGADDLREGGTTDIAINNAEENEEAESDVQRLEATSTLRRSGRATKPVKRLIDTMLANPINRAEIEQTVLAGVYSTVGNAQFMSKEMADIPEWIYGKARDAELNENWLPNMRRVQRSSLPLGGNVISSHFVYKVKIALEHVCGPGKRFDLKARLCVHGNRDAERESLRTDAAVVSHDGFRFLYSASACLGMILGKADIRGAYTQSGEACREVYVQPPREMDARGELWLLTATMYGLVSAGRKWQRASDAAMVHVVGLSVVLGFPQLFYRTDTDECSCRDNDCRCGDPLILLAKYVDDLVIAGRNTEWLEFARAGVGRVFELSSWTCTPSEMTVNSTEVTQTPQDVTVAMHSYVRDVVCVQISPQRRKEPNELITRLEERRVKSVAGKLGYLAVAVSPFAAFASSFIQQQIPKMRVERMKRVNSLVRDVLKKDPVLSYLQPSTEELTQARIVVFSDAGFPHDGEMKKVAQEACIVGIAFGVAEGSIFHTISWQSRKQRRVATSTGEAETIAAVTAVGCARALRDSYVALLNKDIGLTLAVDSKGLHRCLSTQSTPRDRGMIADVHRLRLEYERGDIDDIVWISGTQNPADALTKPHSGETSDVLEKMLVEGRLPVSVNNLREYGRALLEEL